MDSNDLLNIQEAYMDVYSNNQEDELTEDFELWVESLIDEGYDLSDYTWDDMYDFYLDEARKELPTSRMAKQARRKAFNAASETHSDETGIGIVARGDNTARQLRTMARVGGKKVKQHIKKGYEKGRDYDPYYQELNRKNPSRNKYEESYDLYDLVLSHLLDEGYAHSEEQANAIMVNMSEEWIDDILEEGYKKLPVGKMIRQAARKTYKAASKTSEKGWPIDVGEKPHWRVRNAMKDANKMARVASRTSSEAGRKIKAASQGVYSAASKKSKHGWPVNVAGAPNWMVRDALTSANKSARSSNKATSRGSKIRAQGQAELNRRRGQFKEDYDFYG